MAFFGHCYRNTTTPRLPRVDGLAKTETIDAGHWKLCIWSTTCRKSAKNGPIAYYFSFQATNAFVTRADEHRRIDGTLQQLMKRLKITPVLRDCTLQDVM